MEQLYNSSELSINCANPTQTTIMLEKKLNPHINKMHFCHSHPRHQLSPHPATSAEKQT